MVDEELYEEIRMCTEPNARNWLFELQDMLPEQKYVKVMVTLWSIWKARRDVIYEQIFQSPFATSVFIARFIAELETDAVRTVSHRPVQPSMQQSGWIPPPSGMVKANVDAAISDNLRKCAAAAIYRGEDGGFIGASVLVMNGSLEPATVEAIACREALCLAQDVGLNSIVIASDCEGVVQSIKEGTLGENAMIIKEVRELKKGRNDVIFKFESRICNGDAHNIARNSLNLNFGHHLWLVEPPGYVNFSAGD